MNAHSEVAPDTRSATQRALDDLTALAHRMNRDEALRASFRNVFQRYSQGAPLSQERCWYNAGAEMASAKYHRAIGREDLVAQKVAGAMNWRRWAKRPFGAMTNVRVETVNPNGTPACVSFQIGGV